MPSTTTTVRSSSKTGAKNQLWNVTCVPECGFSVTDHNQQSLVTCCQTHIKLVHPDMKSMTEKEVLAMAKRV